MKKLLLIIILFASIMSRSKFAFSREESAVCEDGSYSYSVHDEGTCSHHGGVSEWENGHGDDGDYGYSNNNDDDEDE